MDQLFNSDKPIYSKEYDRFDRYKFSSRIADTGHTGIAVTDREKVEIKSDLDLEKIFVKHIEEIKKKPKFNLWKFLSLKR